MSKEAMKLALEALEGLRNSPSLDSCEELFNLGDAAITALREALAEQPAQQKPVAWVREHELPLAPGDAFSWVETFVHKTPLYTSPPAQQEPENPDEVGTGCECANCANGMGECQQEPVAWMMPDGKTVDKWALQFYGGQVGKPLYTSPPAQQEPVAMRMPKVGDEVICIEDDSLGTVAYLTAGGSPEIRFDDGSHGTYVLREFAELFRYTSTPAQRTWVGLTDEELRQVWYDDAPVQGGTYIDKLRQVETKLKEKNT